MIENYFFDQNGFPQKDEIKREKAVNAVLEIINSAAIHSGSQISLQQIVNNTKVAADAVQAALEKK
ncbi:MAG: hypothetical protein KH310_14420 [Enterobacteriaceae bacterium]|nr:hypothetical protein [Enterobacteriaceae bacterium]